MSSIIALLKVGLAVPDYSTISRRARTVRLPQPSTSTGRGLHLLGRVCKPHPRPIYWLTAAMWLNMLYLPAVCRHALIDSAGLKLCGSGDWLAEKHGTRTLRSWRKLHLGVDAATGRIVASLLTGHAVDDGSQIGPLLDQVPETVTAVLADGAYDRQDVYEAVNERQPKARVVVPPRTTAVPSATANTDPTQRDHHLQDIARHGRMTWQKTTGYTLRALMEAAINRFKRVIGDRLHFHNEAAQKTEIAIAIQLLNRMLDLGRPESVRIA